MTDLRPQSIAALYDIHGNLPALEAVLSEVRSHGVERIVIGGDVVPGPLFREALAVLFALDIPTEFIKGNGEVAVLETRAGGVSEPVPEQAREVIQWTAASLDSEHARWMAAWPMALRREVPGIGPVLFCHGTPRHHNEIFTARTPDDRLRPIFAPLNVALVVCGHTHAPFDRTVGATRVVNAGSVGMPFGDAGADWLLIDGARIESRHTAYDLDAAAARIRQSDYPHADAFVDRFVLSRPTLQQMLEIYSKSELQYGGK